MKLIRITSLINNYIWLLVYNNICIIVDPSTASSVYEFLQKNKIKPVAILLTHYHYDHVGGVEELQKYYPKLIIYGSKETINKGTTNIVKGGDIINIMNSLWQVIAIPGHTLNHIAYYKKPYLFCGDTLFSGGCGRIFEGTFKQMYHSIEILKTLPNNTIICSGHEYTAKNMIFANYLLPYDYEIQNYYFNINQRLIKNQVILPSQLKTEKKINIFLRCNDYFLQKALGFYSNNYSKYDVFIKIRNLKDNF